MRCAKDSAPPLQQRAVREGAQQPQTLHSAAQTYDIAPDVLHIIAILIFAMMLPPPLMLMPHCHAADADAILFSLTPDIIFVSGMRADAKMPRAAQRLLAIAADDDAVIF